MAKPVLSKKFQSQISAAIDQLYERMKARFLGPDPRKRYALGGKNIRFSFTPNLTLGSLYDAASREEGVTPNPDPLHGLLRIAEAYLDAGREKTKARAMHRVQSFLTDAQNKGIKTDVNTVLGGHLTEVWKEATSDIKRIVETETTTARNVSIMDSIGRISAMQGNEDPSIFFVVVRDNSLCSECRRLHLMPDGVTPRVWKQSQLGAGYHKKGEDDAKVAGLHPHCLTGGMRIHTDRGILRVGDLVGTGPMSLVVDERAKNRRKWGNQFGEILPGEVRWNRHGSGSKVLKSTDAGVFDTGVQECLRVELESGHVLEMSLGHEQWIDDFQEGRKVRADQLQVGDKIPLLSGPGLWGPRHDPVLAELAGNLMGDGSLSGNSASWRFFGNDIPYGQKLLGLIKTLGCNLNPKIHEPNSKYSVQSMGFGSTKLARIMRGYGVNKKPRRVPAPIWESDKETVAAFLRGLYAADGHVDPLAVVLAQNDLEFLREVQVLLSNFGIISRIYTHGQGEEKAITYADGTVHQTKRKPCWRLYASGVDNMKIFQKEINFGVPAKESRLVERLAGMTRSEKPWRTSRIASITALGPRPTFCMTEPMTNTISVNGVVTGQCRCVMSMLSPGFGFNASGMVTYISPGFDQYKAQQK